MNKAELVEVLIGRLGTRHAASAALDAVLGEIQEAVARGERVSLSGFGSFEARVRPARAGRNPRTGEPITIVATVTPAFRPGATFKSAVAQGRTAVAANRGVDRDERSKARSAKTVARSAPQSDSGDGTDSGGPKVRPPK